jgi:RNA polymerase sigma-70 factor (ECF subfamily)
MGSHDRVGDRKGAVGVGRSASPGAVSDEALLAGLAVGDPEASGIFIRRFQRRVFGLALGMLGDPSQAEDIAQEAFLRAWRHAATFDPRRATVPTWLLHITRNLAIDALRLRRAESFEPDVLDDLVAATEATAVEDAALTAHSAAAVQAALRQLPDEQTRALLLAVCYGRTAREISVFEGIPLGTAKTRIRLGLRKIHALLLAPSKERP